MGYSSTKTVLDILSTGFSTGVSTGIDPPSGTSASGTSAPGTVSGIGTGTVIVFDDWGGFEGAAAHEQRAWREHCERYGIKFEWIEPPVAAAGSTVAEEDASR